MSNKGIAQNWQYSNKVIKKIKLATDVIIDTKKIVPNTFKVKGFDSSFYSVNYHNNSLHWLKPISEDSVLIEYRYFNFNMVTNAYRYNYDSIKNNFIATKLSEDKFKKNNENPLFGNSKSIHYYGSFGRNLSFGNKQDAVFNSQLNLQITGILADSIEIAAAITDNNIPIQPDGTTQQLNEFDKILLQFKKRNWEMNLGDIDVKSDELHFLNFYKRLQGASYKSVSRNNKNTFQFAGAIAKGKFARNIFNGLEGNQGPYRLHGNNFEFFLIVLAGTERVFIDGVMMQRGEDQDYIINYNTGEIIFTTKHLITKDKRIQVEFEYADRNYLNYMAYASNEIKVNKNLKINLAVYSNSDAKNSPINQQLNPLQKQFLANIGDSINHAFYHSAYIDSFSTTKIMYAKRANPVNINWDSIYVYSTNADSAKYDLNFIDVGLNKGNYIPFFNGANGRVYTYIAPINGIKQGNFEPAIFLVTPKKQQIISVNSVYTINAKTKLIADVALSNYDVNTFSTKHKTNNIGLASKFLFQHVKKMNKELQLQSYIGYEWVDKRFTPIERLRSVEFYRDWGLPIISEKATEHLPKILLELKNIKNMNTVSYLAEGYFRSDNFKAIKNQLTFLHSIDKYAINIKLNTSYAKNYSLLSKGNFTKINSEISRTFKKYKNYEAGINYNLESNVQAFMLNDSLTSTSFSFEQIGAYLKSDIAKYNKWEFSFFTRKNKLPYQHQLLQTDRSNNYNFSVELLQNPKHQIKFGAGYRQLFVKNNFLTNLLSDRTLLARTEFKINEWKGFITGLFLYEIGTGQEQKRDFTYIEVPAGRGEYTWNDYNLDGIQQLNEFEIALYQDLAKYIRIFVPTNQFIKASFIQFNYSLQIIPKYVVSKITNPFLQSFLSKLVIQSSLQSSQKIIAGNHILLNPFINTLADTALINMQQQFSNTISLNRFSNRWGIDVTNIQTKYKALLTYGFESRLQKEWAFKYRLNFKKFYTAELLGKFKNTSLVTPSFSNKNYSISAISIEPKIAYTYLTNYRFQLSYLYSQTENSYMYGGEKAINNKINLEAKWNVINNTSLLSKISVQNILFKGNTGTTVSYIMLDALLPGTNYLWNIELTKRLGNNLELNINYEGRKPASSNTIHIGRAGIRALL